MSSFDLDSYLNETKLDPFVLTFAGREWTLVNFKDVDLNEITTLFEENNELAAVRKAVSLGFGADTDQAEEFAKQRLPVRALEVIFSKWSEGSEEQAQGKGRSRRS